MQHQTVYLTPQQWEAIDRLDFIQRGAGFHITQADLISAHGTDYDGHILVGENMGAPPVRIDRQGNIVERKKTPA